MKNINADQARNIAKIAKVAKEVELEKKVKKSLSSLIELVDKDIEKKAIEGELSISAFFDGNDKDEKYLIFNMLKEHYEAAGYKVSYRRFIDKPLKGIIDISWE